MKTRSVLRVGALAALLTSFPVLPAAWAGDTICFDAVTAGKIEAPMEIVAASNAPVEFRDKIIKGVSGGTYLEIAQGKGNPPKMTAGMASYTIQIDEEGDYVLWCRTWWLDECSNSFFINVDDANPFVFGEDSTLKTWHWVKAPSRLKQLTLAKGKHTLTIRNREDGVCLNQILLTHDKSYVPVDVEKVTTPSAH